MEEGPAIEEPPPPPPLPTVLVKELDSSALIGLQESIPQDFQKIVVHGQTKSPGRRRRAPFQPSDQHLPTARLKLFCFDKTTGKPLANVQVHLKALPSNDPEKVVAKTVSNAFGNRAVSRKDGHIVCKVLAGYSYRVAATASGYHDFGYMGESLSLTPKESEVLQGEVAMIPVRISVVLTLRELRPIHQHDSLQRDTTGQVNALTSLPSRPEIRSGVPPQKVSFYSSEGIKMDFVATTIECQDVLVGWPSTLGNTAETATCTLGVYSTDNTGHCYFYGPKLVGGKRNASSRKPGQREWTTIDVGRWEYARKYHLRTNYESPVFMLFDGFTKQVDYPAHVARYPPRGGTRSPSPPRGRLGPPGRSKEQIMSSFLENAVEVAAAASNGGSVADPNEPTPPPGSIPEQADGSASGAGAAVPANDGAGGDAPVSPVRTTSSRAVGGAAAISRPTSALSRSKSISRNVPPLPSGGEASGSGAAAAAAEGAEMALDAGAREEIEAELRAYQDNNIHNYVDPGLYKLQMKDPSRLLIFFTYSGDGEAAEINRAQNAVVPFTMHAADESFIHPRDGTVMRATKYPVQLYCRARPWFQIAVYDMATLEEVGTSHALTFTIERITTTPVAKAAPGNRALMNGANESLARSRRRRNNMLDDDDEHPLESYLDFEPGGGNDDSMVYPYKLEEVAETATLLYSGTLGEVKDKMWMTPGEKYRVSVQMRSPFMEYNAVQVRTANWELEPFVFYAVKKVVLLVEVREKYNQLPIPNTEIVVEVQEPPQAPRPPVVKPEWCEDPKAYALRVLDQLIDYVVQNNRERAAADEGPIKTYRGFTDAEGLVTFEMPPEARVYVRAINSADFEDTNASREVQLTTMAEQFVGIQLERITRTAAVVLDSNTNEGIAGFELRAYDVTEYTDMPRDGTRKVRHLLDTDMLDAIDTSQMEPFAVETTGPEGAINAPFCRRAGRVIKVEVVRTPRTHHLPSMVMARGKNSTYVVTYDRQSVVFKAPPRPKVMVSCHDTCTFEEVHGVRFRIMVRPFGPPPTDLAGATSARGARSLRTSVSRSSHSRSHAASAVSPSVRAPPSAPVSISVAVDPLPDPDELAGAVELGIGDLASPAITTSITTPVAGAGRGAEATPTRESSAIRLLREQHRGTMAQIEALESTLQAAAADAAADASASDALAPQRVQLEELLAQLKAVMLQQQERLDAMVASHDKKLMARNQAAVADLDDVVSVLEHSTIGAGEMVPKDPEGSLLSPVSGAARVGNRSATSAPGSVLRGSVTLAVPEPTTPASNTAADGGPSPTAPGTSSIRIREPASAGGGGGDGGNGAAFGSGYTGVFGVFAGGVNRMLNRGGGDDDEDEEEALRKLRAAEEEMMAVFNPAPEEQDPWGRIVWDSVTGNEENDDLILDADCEVAVQIFPAWPYDPRSQMLKGRCVGHVGPPEFRFYLPRDGNAFRFWLDRDNALPGFWDEESTPRLPFHSLARLQPSAPSQRLLARAHQDMKLLRPAAAGTAGTTKNGEDDGTGEGPISGAIAQFNGAGGTSIFTSGPKHDWTPRLQLNFNFTSASAAIGGPSGAGAAGNAAAAAARHRLFFSGGAAFAGGAGFPGGAGFAGGAGFGGADGGAEGGSFLGAPGCATDGCYYECESVLPDGSRVLHRTMSAVQFDPNDSSEDINDLAWQQLRLSDASYLPLERTRLLQFLTRWGSFPHVAGGHCKACSGVERLPDTNPLLLAESPPTPRFMGEVPQVGFGVGFSAASGWSRSGTNSGNGGDDAASRLGGGMSVDGAPGALQRGAGGLLYKSRLMSRRELSAKWVFESRPPPRPEGPAVRRYIPDRFSRTHGIMNSSEAVYCRSPFFTWWLPNGGGVHVTMSDGLYRDLIPLIDSVAVSLEYMEQHLEKVRMLNEGRCQEGRFLLGHQVVDSFCGGVFIIDVSTAQPFSGVSFILEQLSKMFDYWASETPMGAPRPRFNILLCSREVIECWRSALGTVTHNLGKRLLPWFEDIKYKMPTAPGFNMVKALRTAGAMAKSEVPIFLLCGGLVENPLNTPSEMSKVLYEMQLACLNSQAPMQPVVAVELFPMPQARLESIARVKTTQSGEEEVTEKRSVPVRMGGHDDTSEVSVEEAATLGSNIFALLVESLTSSRIRLLEVFREVDKDGDHALDWQQLYRLVLRLVPDATPAHVRYVQLLLDCTGDNLVRYKDLAAAMRACGRGGISVSLRDKLEVQLVLHKMAIIMLLSKITPGEMFAKHDNDQDGFWSEKELSAMLKDLFPGLRPAEHQLLFDAWKGVDKNQDGRISLDEFTRAFSSGGVPGLPGSSILAHPDQIQRMKEAGELDDFTIMAMKATEENKRLDRVRAVGFPLSETLVRVAGATRGQHRRLDLGRARAFADRIDLRPLEAVRDSLNSNLQQLLAFEEAYGKQLTYEFHHGRAARSTRAISGSLTADPPSPSPSSGRLTRPSNSARTRVSVSANSPFAANGGATAAAAATGSPGQGGARTGSPATSPVRPRSAARTRPTSRPRSAATAVSASVSAIHSGASRPASAAAAGSGGASARSSRPGSASKTRPPAVAAWVASANASDDPHLRKLASRESIDPEASGGGAAAGVSSPGSISMPPIGRENSANGSHPWNHGHAGPTLSRELSNRSSLLAGLSPGEGSASGGGGGGDDPRLMGRQEYRPPSERSLQRPRASYGSRGPSRGPSAEPSGASIGGEGSGGGDRELSRPSSAPARRRGSGSASMADSAVSASVAMPPLAFSRLPSAAARKSLPLKTATLGFDADDADGLPNIPDPNAPPGGGFIGHHGSGGGAGGRPMSASRRSLASRP